MIPNRKISTDFFGHQGYSPWFFNDFGSEMEYPQIAQTSLSWSICHVWRVKREKKLVRNSGNAIQNERMKLHIWLYFVLILFINYSLKSIRKPHHLVQYDLLYLLMYIMCSKCQPFDEEMRLKDPKSRYRVDCETAIFLSLVFAT